MENRKLYRVEISMFDAHLMNERSPKDRQHESEVVFKLSECEGFKETNKFYCFWDSRKNRRLKKENLHNIDTLYNNGAEDVKISFYTFAFQNEVDEIKICLVRHMYDKIRSMQNALDYKLQLLQDCDFATKIIQTTFQEEQ